LKGGERVLIKKQSTKKQQEPRGRNRRRQRSTHKKISIKFTKRGGEEVRQENPADWKNGLSGTKFDNQRNTLCKRGEGKERINLHPWV